ncbi:MAG: DUF3794 domain-containing protein [Oscillospiraceae bacterium]|nr:DUF3794 domain-containing protein [Oscillospiraceae bacterium]
MNFKNQSSYSTKLPKTSSYFKEETVSETLTIPSQKPDMERILDIMVWAEIENYKLIETEIGKSYEGQNLTGYKLIVEVSLKEKVTYVADRPEQSVHAAHFETLKSMFIILPKEINGKNICNLVDSKAISVTPYIEAVHAKMINARTLHKCVLLLVDADYC